MVDTPNRCSATSAWFQQRQVESTSIGHMPVAMRLHEEDSERAALPALSLCDVSGPEKLGLKGRDATRWLTDQNIAIPADVYQSLELADAGVVVRMGAEEFFLESGVANWSVPALVAQLGWLSGIVFPIRRQEATFLLAGSRSVEVLTQTCGIDFGQQRQGYAVLTRVAGTSCGILPCKVGDISAFRLWVDYSQAAYLWATLVEILHDLDGKVIGVGCLFPELSDRHEPI